MLRLLFQRCKPKVQSSFTFHFQKYPFKSYSSLSSLVDLYSDPHKSNIETLKEFKSLTSNNTKYTNDHVTKLFSSRGVEPGSAKEFYTWVVSEGTENLSSNAFNRLLGMLGGNGLVSEFWELVEVMRKKGYGVKRGASVRALEKFGELGLEGDVKKLNELFALGSVGGTTENAGLSVCTVIRAGPWGEDVEKKVLETGVVFTSDLVKMVLENVGMEGNKAVIFFRWVEESGVFKHDEVTYNAFARELAKEGDLEKFWRVVDEMRGAGCDMEKGTYVRVLSQFVRKKMLKDAVELYEFAMGGNVKPSLQDCVFLLRKIVTSGQLDMELFSKVLKVYKEGGNTLTNSELDTVLKSLTSVGRFSECNKILRAMEEVGFYPNEKMQSKIGLQLSKDSKTEEASEFLDFVGGSGTPSYKTLSSLIEGYCVSDHLDKACDCFEKLVKSEGAACAGFALETLTNAYCSKGKADDAYKLFSDAVIENGVKPWHTTYKLLISKLLDQGSFKEATTLFAPMKAHGYPPYLDPFVKYVAKTGTTEDTVMFLKEMTVKKVPSTAVYLRVFKAYFKAGRHREAQDFLSKCPRFIRNHVDVLNLFSSMQRVKVAAVSAPVAA